VSNPPIHLRGGANTLLSLASLARGDRDAAPGKVAASPDHFTKHSIGVELDLFRRELTRCGQDLRSSQPSGSDSFIDETLQLLGRLACKIAVIGQVKAGKSSFINAFVRRPGLLPTDVNPWTTAVTQLHFGRGDAPPNVAAVFSFFDANEWQRLAEGGGQLRDLTKRLVPGFEAELLQAHVDSMRRRSEGRLGATLGELLGQRHSYAALSPQLLERYVCAGTEGLASVDHDQKGYYSDVVKTADLYFDACDFAFPTTILDTPGTNDPFLVRDEITRGALESADVYIVVLTARQALSSADVALLRILRGLHKHRIAVFINRIDELGDVIRDTPQIIQHVRAGLRREFPDAEIPIVAGSAHWAGLAIAGGEAEIKRALTPKNAAYIAQLAARSGANPALATPLDKESKDQLSQALLLSSGLPALSDVLEGLTLRSHAGQVLKQIKASFSELVHVNSNAARHELDGLATEARLAVTGRQQGEEELRLIAAEIEDNNRLTAALHSLLIDLQARTDQVISDRCDSMNELLRDVLQGYAEMECQNLRQAAAAGQRNRVWRCPTASLRRDLEECFVRLHKTAESEIGGLETGIFPRLRDMLREAHPQWTDQADKLDRASLPSAPSLKALGTVVALDLEEPWWKRWLSGRHTVDEQVYQLDCLIVREFGPIIDSLIASSRTQLKAQQSAALDKATKIYLGLVEIFQEQSTAQLRRMRVLISARDALQQDELRGKRDIREAELKRQLSITEEVRARLSAIDQRWGERAE
jgi:signal recognition particle receptor subunit beta